MLSEWWNCERVGRCFGSECGSSSLRMLRFFLPLALCPVVASGLTIELRYDLDAAGFFNQPGAKEAVRAVADFYERVISDQLGAINSAQYPGKTWTPTYADPATGLAVDVPGQSNMVVPANTIIIFLGSTEMPGQTAAQGGPGGVDDLSAEALGSGHPWANQVYSRGEAGAIHLVQSGNQMVFTTNPTDFAPWGGVIFFNSLITDWNFSTTSATAAAGPDAVSVTLHEMAHVLGIGALLTQNSWTTLAKTGAFAGPLAAQSFGSQIATDGVHVYPFGTNSRAFGVFGRTHGASTTPLMVPNLPNGSFFYVPTDLELAILQDMGWDIEPPVPVIQMLMNPGPQLRIPSTTGFTYQVARSETLGPWTDQLPLPTQGNGTRLTWNDPQASSAAFYKVTRQKAGVVAMASAVTVKATDVSAGGNEMIVPPALHPARCVCGGH